MLKRLSPVVRRYDLGYLRLWQDDLAEIIRLMRQINGAEVRVEVKVGSDDYLVEDIKDLPSLGSQVSSFKATGSRTHDEVPRQLMEVRLSREACEIEATDPDLTTVGAIEAIASLTFQCRRSPLWLMKVFRSSPGLRWDKIVVYSLGVSAISYLMCFIVASIIVGLVRDPGDSVPVPILVLLGVVAALLCIGMITGYSRAKSVLFTGTRAEAPTWWQRHRSDIAINIGVSIVFYLLGLLTSHL